MKGNPPVGKENIDIAINGRPGVIRWAGETRVGLMTDEGNTTLPQAIGYIRGVLLFMLSDTSEI